MLRFLFRRFLLLIFLMFGITIIVFLIANLVPTDPVVAHLSQRALNDPEVIAAFEAKWGLDKPLHEQYTIYLSNLLKGDMGISLRTKRPVLTDLAEYFPATVELAVLSMTFALIFGIFFGIVSAIKRNSVIDQFARVISITGVSIPSFWFALIVIYAFYYKLGWAVSIGRFSFIMESPARITGLYILDGLLQGRPDLSWVAFQHLILPSVVLGCFSMGLITRTMRSSLLEVLSTEYIRTARAKGLTYKMTVLRHAVGNAFIPVITIIGLGFGNLLSGTVLVETIFAWPGIGQYAYQSAKMLDFPAIIGVSLLISAIYVSINLIVDIFYGVLDPRVRYD